MEIQFDYIKQRYKVPADMNREVEFEGRRGIIVEDKGNYIGVMFYDDKKQNIYPLHPTYNITYLESFGTTPKVKNLKSKQRYLDYLKTDGYNTFAEYLGIKK